MPFVVYPHLVLQPRKSMSTGSARPMTNVLTLTQCVVTVCANARLGSSPTARHAVSECTRLVQ
jgi:hypothetical protein